MWGVAVWASPILRLDLYLNIWKIYTSVSQNIQSCVVKQEVWLKLMNCLILVDIQTTFHLLLVDLTNVRDKDALRYEVNEILSVTISK